MTPVLACVGLTWLALGSGSALAHDLRPGVLSLAETSSGTYAMRFVAPVDDRGESVEVTIELPSGCARDREEVRCGGDIDGPISVSGMRGDAMRTIVQLTRLDGTRAEWVVSADSPHAVLGARPPCTWSSWVAIGARHILGGIDHLAFVIGLLLVLGLRVDRRLLLTLSAFTVAHSLTLALAVLGVVRVEVGPVEACIAASVLLVAREALHRDPTALRRWPWLAAGLFGLLHGLGFASALGELGLSRASVVSNLLWFNVGVELGQLAIVGAVVLLAGCARQTLARRASVGPRAHAAACYALGSTAAWWLLDRTVALWSF